jgi:hypothetical protein
LTRPKSDSSLFTNTNCLLSLKIFLNQIKRSGVTFASDGKWTVHIENIATSALKQVNVLRKLKCILSKQALSNIYLTFVIPVLEYACEVWDGCYERNIEKLDPM